MSYSSESLITLSWKDFLADGFRRSLVKNIPTKIVDIPDDFAPVTWTLEKLEDRFGEIVLRVLRSESQYFVYSDKQERTIVQMTLSEFLEKGMRNIGCDGFYYTLGRSPIHQFGDLYREMKLPSSIAEVVDGHCRFPERNLWMSPKGTRTALHFDAVENFNLQIVGSKSFLLFPPRIQDMYSYPWSSQAAYVSKVDPRHSSKQSWSRFPFDESIEVVLNKGEMLYLPYGWWHQVDTVGDVNMNCNYWWFPRLKLATFPRQTLRGMMVLLNRMGSHPHDRAQRMNQKHK